MNKPERLNALDQTGHNHMTYVWNAIDKDPDISSVILTAKGRAFSAGGDFDMIGKMIDDYHARIRSGKEAKDLVYNIINCGKPIVSAMNGVPSARACRPAGRYLHRHEEGQDCGWPHAPGRRGG